MSFRDGQGSLDDQQIQPVKYEKHGRDIVR